MYRWRQICHLHSIVRGYFWVDFSKLNSGNDRFVLSICMTKGKICQWQCMPENNGESFTCVCPDGFMLIGNTCTDINECNRKFSRPCAWHTGVHNLPWLCTYKSATLRHVKKYSVNPCDENHICLNNHGSVTCKEKTPCPSGFTAIKGWKNEFERTKQG